VLATYLFIGAAFGSFCDRFAPSAAVTMAWPLFLAIAVVMNFRKKRLS
jgi:hypothetical protein